MLLTAFCKKLCPDLETVSKSVRMMKIVALFLLAGCMQLSAKTVAQGLSLSLNNVPLSTAFNEIEQKTAYRFVYTNEQLSATSKITLSVQNVPLEKVLELCFKDQRLTWAIEDKFIIVKTKEKKIVTGPVIENEIRGKVMNERGEPVVGATVSLKGSQKATATDNKGEFVLADVVSGSVIIVSSIGFESQELIIGNNRYVTIHLQTSVSALDEMIIKGYYNTSRMLNTGAVSKLNSEELSKSPVSNVLAAAQGRMSGVYITQQTGVSGGDFSIQVRGLNSIASGNNPLYIIDGVPFSSTSISSATLSSGITRQGNPLNSINPADIESIEILKDADATAIYGSRGANGVVLITTKKGKAGKTNVDLNGYSGIAKVGRYVELMNTSQYLTMRREAFKNDGAVPSPTDVDINGTWDTTRNTDWQKSLIGGTAHINNWEASVSGGNKNTQFMVGLGYHQETTVFPGDLGSNRSSGHFSIHHTSTNEKFYFQLSAGYTKNKTNLQQFDLTYLALTLPPDAPPVYDESGKLNWANSTWFNPMSYLLQKYKSVTYNYLVSSLLSYKILPSLELKTNIGYTKMDVDEITTSPISSYQPSLNVTTGSASFSGSGIETWIIEPQLNWTKSIGKGRLNAIIGGTFQQNLSQRQTLSATGYANDALLENTQAASFTRITEYVQTDYRYMAVFARLGYNLDNKYLINLTARRDGSSRFGPDNQFANFGAAGLGWIFSKEKFIQQRLPFISFGKIRFSYGITGNDQIPDYGYLDTYRAATYAYQGIAALNPSNLFNPDYGWETNKKLEAGIELGFFNNRIFLTCAVYRNLSSNQLVGYPLAPTSGFSSLPYYNLPATIQNTGLEIDFTSVNLKNKNVQWTSTVNLTVPRNKLVSFPGLEQSNYVNRYIVGEPLSIQKVYHYTGLNPQTGVYQFEDVDKDGVLTANDYSGKFNIAQQYYGGIENIISYRNLECSFFIQFVKQTGYDYFANLLYPMPGSLGNQPVDVLNRWQKPGDLIINQQYSQNPASPTYNAYFNNSLLSDRIGTDASFARLKNINLSFQFPDKWMNRFRISKLKIYAQAQNLLTVTSYRGIDPENNDQRRMAPLRTITAGIKITL